jgi:hypothetical protein
MLCKENGAVCYEAHKNTQMQCDHHVEFLDVKPVGT